MDIFTKKIALIMLFFLCSTTTAYGEEIKQEITQTEIESETVEETKTIYDDLQTTAETNLRKTPSSDGQILITVPSGQVVNVLEDGDDWVKVRYLTTVGYMSRDYLTSIWIKEALQSTTERPICEELNQYLSEEVQQHLWNRCCEAYDNYEDQKYYYIYLIGTIDLESEFKQRCVSKWGDYGLGQINKRWVWPDAKKALGLEGDVSQILDDPYKAIDCMVWEMNRCVASAGSVSEEAYHKYNKGKNCKGTDATSHAMVKKWNKWKNLFDSNTEE